MIYDSYIQLNHLFLKTHIDDDEEPGQIQV